MKNNGIADSSTEVRIIQRWNGFRPAINWMLYDFRHYLIQEKIDNVFNKRTELERRCSSRYHPSNSQRWPWIEALLKTPIEDYRKFTIWRILAPYVVNVRKELTHIESFNLLKNWLEKCSEKKPLDFNPVCRIKYNLKAAAKIGYFPISLNDLKEVNRELYAIITDQLDYAGVVHN